jgi:anionic cell wall polymer biosynthesis LytR-Cps2A-Psr (LCP) family protein
MDGYLAQKYARTRHGDSDFDRASRQQQVIFAIRDRVLAAEALPQLIVRAPSLYGSISQNVYTGFSLEEIIRLGLWLKDIPAENIHSGVMDQRYVSDFMTPDGAAVLMPIPAALPTLLAQVFGSDYAQS